VTVCDRFRRPCAPSACAGVQVHLFSTLFNFFSFSPSGFLLLLLLHLLLLLLERVGWRKSLYLALYRNPTVFWLASSDLALKAVCALGALAAALLVAFRSLYPLWWLISVCRHASTLFTHLTAAHVKRLKASRTTR
jgi:hypothetical protein